MSALRKPEDVAAEAVSDLPTADARTATDYAVRERDRETAAWLLRVRETAVMTEGGRAALEWCALQIASGEGDMPVRPAAPPEPEEHPLDALRRLTPNMWAPDDTVSVPPHVLAYALSEIVRLTEALAAAVRERDENAADRDIYGRERDEARRERNALQDEIDQLHCPRDDAPDSTPDPDAARRALVALASDLARGPMGASLLAWRTTNGGGQEVNPDGTADNVLAVARRILEAT